MDKQKDFEKGWEEYKEKKKQEIEEMYQDFLNFKFQNSSPETFSYKGLVEHLHRAGYRKIPKGAVVLTREEYDELTLTKQSIFDMLEERDDKARKETAEKFAERLKSEKYLIQGLLKDSKICHINHRTIDEIAKEITEGKK